MIPCRCLTLTFDLLAEISLLVEINEVLQQRQEVVQRHNLLLKNISDLQNQVQDTTKWVRKQLGMGLHFPASNPVEVYFPISNSVVPILSANSRLYVTKRSKQNFTHNLVFY